MAHFLSIKCSTVLLFNLSHTMNHDFSFSVWTGQSTAFVRYSVQNWRMWARLYLDRGDRDGRVWERIWPPNCSFCRALWSRIPSNQYCDPTASMIINEYLYWTFWITLVQYNKTACSDSCYFFQFYSRTARVNTSPPFYKREAQVKDKSTLKSLYSEFSQAVENAKVISFP